MKKVVVVGAGMMGSGIAAMSALAGNPTVLVDTLPEKAQLGLEKALGCVAERTGQGLAAPQAGEIAKNCLSATHQMEEALKDASLVIEAVFENLELKQRMFAELDGLLPAEVPILSNTSGLRITEIAAKVKRYPQRTMTAHFWLPAHLVPLVEIVMWEKTDEAMAVAVREELALWDKAPVLVRRDLPGQLANRILQAIIREACNIVGTGLASPEDVDTAVKMGMGIRFPAWGPLEHVDAVGLDLCLSVQEGVLPGLCNEDGNVYMRELVEKGHLGYKSGQGVYDWSKKDMEAQVAKRNAFIINALKQLRDPQ